MILVFFSGSEGLFKDIKEFATFTCIEYKITEKHRDQEILRTSSENIQGRSFHFFKREIRMGDLPSCLV